VSLTIFYNDVVLAGLNRSCPAVGAGERGALECEVPAACDIRVQSLLVLRVFLPAVLRHLPPRFWQRALVHPCFQPVSWLALVTHARLASNLAPLMPHRLEYECQHVLRLLVCPEQGK